MDYRTTERTHAEDAPYERNVNMQRLGAAYIVVTLALAIAFVTAIHMVVEAIERL